MRCHREKYKIEVFSQTLFRSRYTCGKLRKKLGPDVYVDFKRSQQLILKTMSLSYYQTKLTQPSNQYQDRRHLVIALGALITAIYQMGLHYYFQLKGNWSVSDFSYFLSIAR